jgi:integrase
MTTHSPSRATLRDVLSAIDNAEELTGKRKQDLRSAVRLAARVLGAEPQLIAADPRAIGRRLDGISHLSLGVSAGRWANSRSLLRSALKLVVPVMPGASAVALLPQWEPLADEARKVGSCWLRLGRLLRWLSMRGITPAAITHADLDQFHAAYLSDTLHSNPEQSWQAARQSWERMRVACPSWPQIVLEATLNPKVFSLPWEAFPASLKAEVDLLLERLAGKDLSDEGPSRPLRPATLKMRTYELRTFASALVRQGLPAESLASLATCLSLDAYKRGLQWFYERGGSKPTRTVHNLAANLKAIARHWLKADEATLAAMSRIVSRLAPPEQGMSSKNRDRLRPFDSQENLQAIANLPRTIRRHLETAKSAKARKKGLSTAAMAIELLLVAPIRLSNLCQLHLDHNFIKVGDRVHLFIPKEDVKNRTDLEFELLPETVALLDWYVSSYRKADLQNRYVFVSKGLDHKDLNTLRLQIMETVKTFTGLTVNPHLFRAIAGTIYLQAYPGAYEVVRQVLGHRNIATTTNFYTGQEERRARQHFIGTIQKLREQPAVKPGRKGKKP